jgi:hypothetical protein
MVIS